VDFLHLAGAAFLELPQLGVVVTDINYRVAYWSKGAERLLDIDSDHATGRQLDQIIQFPDIRDDLRASLTEVEPHQARKSDERMLVETICVPLKDAHHNATGFLLVMQDITGRRRDEQARAEAEEANRTKDKFIAMVAHELRTPLNAILNWAHLFRTGTISPTEVSRAFATMEHNARSLSKLIEDLLDICRTVAGKLRLDVGPVGLCVVINEAVHSLRPAAANKHIAIKTTLDDTVGAVAGDLDRLQQIVFNLLSNAIKFTPEKGHIEIKLERAGSKGRITVSDTGPGISEEFLPFIFEPFSQADARSSHRRGGLGLGLAMARHLIELHGGTIQVSSREGHGASFTVELPLWRYLLAPGLEARRGNPADKPNLPLAGLRVILVDDCLDMLEMLEVALTHYGAAVKLATTTSEAIEVLRHWKPDVLVSDIAMPYEDGYALITKVRRMESKLGGSTPAIALSGYSVAEHQERAISAGYQMLITKPVELSQLEAAIALLAGR
jgi:PAS domain S-box-containing protein